MNYQNALGAPDHDYDFVNDFSILNDTPDLIPADAASNRGERNCGLCELEILLRCPQYTADDGLEDLCKWRGMERKLETDESNGKPDRAFWEE